MWKSLAFSTIFRKRPCPRSPGDADCQRKRKPLPPCAFFGEAPGFAPGNRLNAMVLADDQELAPYPLNGEKRLERAVYRRQKDAIRAVYSGERKVYSAE